MHLLETTVYLHIRLRDAIAVLMGFCHNRASPFASKLQTFVSSVLSCIVLNWPGSFRYRSFVVISFRSRIGLEYRNSVIPGTVFLFSAPLAPHRTLDARAVSSW
jgi:hypothetical protein